MSACRENTRSIKDEKEEPFANQKKKKPYKEIQQRRESRIHILSRRTFFPASPAKPQQSSVIQHTLSMSSEQQPGTAFNNLAQFSSVRNANMLFNADETLSSSEPDAEPAASSAGPPQQRRHAQSHVTTRPARRRGRSISSSKLSTPDSLPGGPRVVLANVAKMPRLLQDIPTLICQTCRPSRCACWCCPTHGAALK